MSGCHQIERVNTAFKVKNGIRYNAICSKECSINIAKSDEQHSFGNTKRTVARLYGRHHRLLPEDSQTPFMSHQCLEMTPK